MNHFIRRNLLPYEVVKDLQVLGTQTRHVSDAFDRATKERAWVTCEKPRKARGRPGEFRYRCTFCKVLYGP